ncbi:MAG: hypothetical protein IIC70_12695 [Acidobacteria bacterium]|nr:hypothetical protein [Acidobacteriota bacterium]
MASKADRLRAEADMADVDADYVKAKAAGWKKVYAAREKAFAKAKTAAEYQELVRKIPPALTNDVKLKHRALVRAYREKWRAKPVAPAGGAQPDTARAVATVQEPG